MNKHYLQLTLEQRYQIWAMQDSGKTQREMAEVVGVHHSTISRELRRHKTGGVYEPKKADQISDVRQRTAEKARKRNDPWIKE